MQLGSTLVFWHQRSYGMGVTDGKKLNSCRYVVQKSMFSAYANKQDIFLTKP